MLTKEFFKKYERDPSPLDRKINFELQSINLWVLDEIFRYLDENRKINELDALNNFVKLMDEYACMARTNKTKTMYSAAKAYAEYVLDCNLSEFAFKEV